MQYEVSVNVEARLSYAQVEDVCGPLQLDGSGSPPESTDLWHLHAQIVCSSVTGEPLDSTWIEVRGPMDGSVSGRFDHGAIALISDGQGKLRARRIDLVFNVGDSSGSFAGSGGTIRLYGTVQEPTSFLTADLDLDAPATLWKPPASSLLSSRDAAAGASPTGPQPLSQLEAEQEAEEGLIKKSQRNANGQSTGHS